LDFFAQLWLQPDADADRNPDDRGKRNQDDDAQQRQRAIARGGSEIVPGECRSGMLQEDPTDIGENADEQTEPGDIEEPTGW